MLLRKWGAIALVPAMAFVMPPVKPMAPADLPAEVSARLAADVRDKLTGHYQADADAKAGGCFDFRDRSHTVLAEGLVWVRGDYLFSARGRAVRTGRVDLFYTAGDSGWSALEHYRLEERAVPLQALAVQVRDGLSGEPLAGATVVARSGVRHSAALRTGARGEARLTLLQGSYQVFATHPRYHSGVAPSAGPRAPDIYLLPLTQP